MGSIREGFPTPTPTFRFEVPKIRKSARVRKHRTDLLHSYRMWNLLAHRNKYWNILLQVNDFVNVVLTLKIYGGHKRVVQKHTGKLKMCVMVLTLKIREDHVDEVVQLKQQFLRRVSESSTRVTSPLQVIKDFRGDVESRPPPKPGCGGGG